MRPGSHVVIHAAWPPLPCAYPNLRLLIDELQLALTHEDSPASHNGIAVCATLMINYADLPDILDSDQFFEAITLSNLELPSVVNWPAPRTSGAIEIIERPPNNVLSGGDQVDHLRRKAASRHKEVTRGAVGGQGVLGPPLA